MSVRVHPIGREAGREIEVAGSRHDSVRRALEYYLAYADESASPGFWVGAGAEASFGFATGSPVAREDFVAVMTVRDPATGELLSPRTRNLIRRDRRPGFDVVFRMERSAALAFVACPEARSAIRAAHEEGIRQAISYFEQELLVRDPAPTLQVTVGEDARSVSEVAKAFGVSWGTVMGAVVEHGTPLIDDPARACDVVALGVDETSWLAATPDHPTLFATGLVDIRRAQLVDVIEGRDAGVLRS